MYMNAKKMEEALADRDIEKTLKLQQDAIQNVTEDVVNVLNPISAMDRVSIALALDSIVKAIKLHFSDDDQALYSFLENVIESVSLAIPTKKEGADHNDHTPGEHNNNTTD